MESLKQIMWLILLTGFIGTIIADDADTNDLPTTTPEDDYDEPKIPKSYAFAFETENGQVRDENIKLNPVSSSSSSSSPSKMEVNVKGSYSFISADGYEYTVFYKANKKGYQPYVTAHKIQTDKDKTD